MCGIIVLLEGTPLYNPSVDAAILDPYRDESIVDELFDLELDARDIARRTGLIKAIWGAEVDEFVWEWLYEGPKLKVRRG